MRSFLTTTLPRKQYSVYWKWCAVCHIKVVGECHRKPVTTFSGSCSCCHCPVAATLVSVAAASLSSLWLLSSPSRTSCCLCHCLPAPNGTDWHLSMPHQGAEAVPHPRLRAIWHPLLPLLVTTLVAMAPAGTSPARSWVASLVERVW